MIALTTWTLFIAGLILHGLWAKHQNSRHMHNLAQEDRMKNWNGHMSYYFVNGKLTIDPPRNNRERA